MNARLRTAWASIRHFTTVLFRRLARDRVSLFFLVVLPVVVITVIGITFGGAASFDIGVVRGQAAAAGDTATRIEDALDATDGVGIVVFDTADDLRGAVRRQAVSLGIVFADDTDARIAAGEPWLTVIAEPSARDAQAAGDVVRSAVSAELSPADAARFAADLSGASYDDALTTAGIVEGSLPAVDVQLIDVGDRRSGSLSSFSLVAPQQLVLFVFINAMAGGAALVRMRRTGVLRRVLAGPITAGDIVIGVMAAWFVVSLVQTALIMGIGSLVFGVSWGDPIGALLLAVAFSAVGAGAGLLVGAFAGNEDRVSAISPPFGIVLGALGGCMVPLEIFPKVMRTVSRFTPQGWAMTAWERLVFDGDGVGSIVGPLAVLAGFATVFLGLAVVALRRDLLRG
ncbi:MAG: ABC transporter permease [Acidimicrobiales bacterium]